jgi:hypothetical protein
MTPGALTGVALTLLWNIARGALEIGGSATCPSPAQVEAELERRGGAPTSPISSDQRAELDEEATGDSGQHRLRLRLFDAAGQMLGERTLLADPRCKEMAATVATLLLSFELDLGEAPPRDAPEPVLYAPVPAPVRRMSLAAEVGAGELASLTSDGEDAFSVLALASIAIDRSPFQPELEAEIESARQLRVGGALARWERLWVAPGLQFRFLRRPGIWASAHLDVPVGALIASGSNLAPNRSGAVFDLGVSGGVRLGLGSAILSRAAPGGSGFVPWAGLWIIGWPLQRELFLSNASNQARPPPFELLLGLGLSWSGI